MKKYASGFVAALGTASAALTLANELPQYEKIFLVLIGICLGFFLGSLSKNDESRIEPMSDKTKSLLFTIIIFVVPVILLMLLIVLLSVLNLTESINMSYVLGWSVFLILCSYIAAGSIVCGWKEAHNKRLNK